MNVFNQPKLVIVETPYRATPYYTKEQHHLYLLHCIEECVRNGEAPFASHLLLPDVLDDDDQLERAYGVRCGFAWGQHADLVAIFSDFGVSDGMKDAIEHWSKLGKRIEWRKLPDKVVRSIKQFGEQTQQEPSPDEDIHYPIGASLPLNGG